MRKSTLLLVVYFINYLYADYVIDRECNSEICSLSRWRADMLDTTQFYVEPSVEIALREGRAIVALESTIITHGMPYPQNLETAREVEQIIREMGAVPATIAIINGKIHIGLNSEQLHQLALSSNAVKTSRRDIAYTMALNLTGATTVSATALLASHVGIPVFVTGGIGGVHIGGEETMDISADLRELGRTPIAVICAGAKSILDIGRTLEYLETEGVTVISYQTDEFPAFFTRHSGHKTHVRLNTTEQCARVIDTNFKLQLGSGIIVAVPIPERDAADGEIIQRAIQQALQESVEKHIIGKETTPFLLARIKQLTGGKSLESNIALVKNNARVGAQIALDLARLRGFGGAHTTVNSVQTSNPPVIVGGSVIDMIAKTHSSIIPSTSNPGIITQRFGGVGRNVAEVLARMGASPLLLSAVGGSDTQGQSLLLYSTDIGMSTRGLKRSLDHGTAVYNAILDSAGEMHVAVADMDIFNSIDEEFIAEHLDDIMNAPIALVDGNVKKEVLQQICNSRGKVRPTWFEPTSIPKSIKAADLDILSKLTYISPNKGELRSLAAKIKSSIDDHQTDFEHILESAQILVDSGVTNVIVKMGKDGVLLASKENVHDLSHFEQQFKLKSAKLFKSKDNSVYFIHYSAPKVSHIKSVTGAGDSLAGGTIWALLQNYKIQESIYFGLAAAKLSLESDHAVNPSLSFESLHGVLNDQ